MNMNHHHQSTTTRTTTTATTTTTTTRTQPLTLSPRPSNLTQHSTIKSSKSHSRPPTSAALPLSHIIHQPPPPPPSDYNPTHSFTSSPFTSHHPKRKSSSNQLTIHQIQPEPITQNNPTTIIKKRRRRRSAITGTLYNPDEEPDPDQEILSQSNHQASLHSSSSQKSKSTLIELHKKSQSKPSQSSSSSNVLEKKFACDWIGCQKVFSRPDHLSRHRLNHEPEKIYSCDRCPRKFVRADLLTRHVERHEKKAAASKLQGYNQIPFTRFNHPPINNLSPKSNAHPNQLHPSHLPSSQSHPSQHPLPPVHPHPTSHEHQHCQVGENQHHSLSPHAIHSQPLSSHPDSQHYPGSPLLNSHQLKLTDGSQPPFPISPHLIHHHHRISIPNESTSFSIGQPSPLLIPEAKVEGLGGRRTSDPPMIITDPKSVQNPDYEISSSTPYSSIPFPSTTNTTPLISRGKEMVEEKASYGTDEFNLTQGLPGLFLSTDNFAVDVPFFTGQDFQWLFDGSLDDLDQHQHLFHPTPNLLLEPTHHLDPTRSTTDHHQLQNEEENKNGFVKEMNRCHDLSGYQSIQPPPPPPPLQDDRTRWNGNGLELVNHQHHQPQPHPSLNEEKKFKGPLLRIHSIGHHPQIQVQEKSEEILRSIPFLPPPPPPLPPSSTTPLPSFPKNRMMNRTSTEPDSFSNRFELDPTNSKSQESHPSHHHHPQLASVRPIRDLSVYVSFETRDRILQTVKNELSFLENDHRFGCEEISKYLNLYWIHVHQTSFPILHRPTFKTSEASVFLLCLMICLGAYFTDSEGHELATILYEDIRKRVISSPEFKPRASLDIIQVTLLMILYGKLCSTRNHHEMAHIFWGSILTMYRRSALFSPRVSSIPNELKNSIDVQWKVWIEDESSKRAAYAAFLIDVQHAAIFRHAPTLSAFQIQHVLPSDEEEWNAKDSISWNEIHLRILSHQRRMGGGGGGGGEEEEDEENYQGGGNRGTLFMSALKASLMPGMAPPFLNPFSRVVILHGLISVAFDLQWRDVFMIGLVTSNETPSIHPNGIKKDWREMIAAAFNSWKICLDSCLISSNAPAHQLLTASISIYALAHIVLSIDVHELQIYTGAEITIGLTVANQVAQKNTKSKVKRWAHTKEGRASTWHAAHFLRSSLIDLDQVNETLDSLHYTWACYISVLTVVAYGTALNEIEMDLMNEEEEGWNGWVQKKKKDRSLSRLKLNEIKSNPFQIATNYLDKMCTSCPEDLKDLNGVDHQVESIGLIEMIYRVIKSSRWEIALEGAKILDGLIISKSKDLI